MKHEERCNLGKIARYCDEGRQEIELDENGKLKSIRVFGKAKDFKKPKVEQNEKHG